MPRKIGGNVIARVRSSSRYRFSNQTGRTTGSAWPWRKGIFWVCIISLAANNLSSSYNAPGAISTWPRRPTARIGPEQWLIIAACSAASLRSLGAPIPRSSKRAP
jgi:hypothetical protein